VWDQQKRDGTVTIYRSSCRFCFATKPFESVRIAGKARVGLSESKRARRKLGFRLTGYLRSEVLAPDLTIIYAESRSNRQWDQSEEKPGVANWLKCA
jgi:hypothetical protein